MKFPRNARALVVPLNLVRDAGSAAPWVAVMFLLVIFIMLGGLLYTPGVHVQLPITDELPGTDKPTVTVAIDAAGQLYFENQRVANESALTNRWREIIQAAPEKPVLVIQADKSGTNGNLVRLMQLGRAAGFETAVWATLPRPFGKTVPFKP